jgi:ATP-binding cassette subfamily B protein
MSFDRYLCHVGVLKRTKSDFFRLLQLARPEWRLLSIGFVFLVISSGLTLIYPQAIRMMIDQIFSAEGLSDEGRLSLMNKAALLLILIFVVQAVTSSLRFYFFTVAGERSVLRLRHLCFSKLVDREIPFFDSRSTGELMSRLASDASVLQKTVSVNLSMLVRHLATGVGGLALMIYSAPRLAGLMIVIILPLTIFAARFGRRVRRFSRDSQDALAESSQIAEEALALIRTVKSFLGESFEKDRYQKSLYQSFVFAKLRTKVMSIFIGVATGLGFVAIAAVLWVGGQQVIEQTLSVGALTSFLIYMVITAISVAALAGLFTDFMSAFGAAKRVFELLDDEHPALAKNLPSYSQATQRLNHLAGENLRFEKVDFSYPQRAEIKVLHELSFEIEAGKKVAFVGPSGAGKTSIASLILRFYSPQGGKILWGSKDLQEFSAQELRQEIGYVAQEPSLFSGSIEENIRYAKPEATHQELVTACRQANMDEFLQHLPQGLQTKVGEKGIQLSGGQKQRVAIARALLKNPSLLILDEATSALDSESEYFVQEALLTLMKNRTTLIIAHRLSSIKEADEVLVIDQGRLIQRGSHQSLVEQEGMYQKLVQRQFLGMQTGKV